MTDAKELKPLSKKHQRVMDEYFLTWSQWRSYKKVFPKVTDESARQLSSRLFADVNFSAHLQERMNDVHMSADKALKNISDIADADLGVFWKVSDEWMYHPLPEYEILDEKEVIETDEEGEEIARRICYRVRHVVLDMDKVIDPKYSHLIHEFSNSRKTGLSIKTYNRHDANRDILKIYGRFAPEKIDMTNSDGSLKPEQMKPSEIAERVAALLAKKKNAK